MKREIKNFDYIVNKFDKIESRYKFFYYFRSFNDKIIDEPTSKESWNDFKVRAELPEWNTVKFNPNDFVYKKNETYIYSTEIPIWENLHEYCEKNPDKNIIISINFNSKYAKDIAVYYYGLKWLYEKVNNILVIYGPQQYKNSEKKWFEMMKIKNVSKPNEKELFDYITNHSKHVTNICKKHGLSRQGEGGSSDDYAKRWLILVKHFLKNKYGNFFEVGYNEGAGLNLWKILGCKTLFSFEILKWEKSVALKYEFDKMFSKYNANHWIVVGDSAKTMPIFNKIILPILNIEIDLAFIDGDHRLLPAYLDIVNMKEMKGVTEQTRVLIDNIVPHRGVGRDVFAGLCLAKHLYKNVMFFPTTLTPESQANDYIFKRRNTVPYFYDSFCLIQYGKYNPEIEKVLWQLTTINVGFRIGILQEKNMEKIKDYLKTAKYITNKIDPVVMENINTSMLEDKYFVKDYPVNEFVKLKPEKVLDFPENIYENPLLFLLWCYEKMPNKIKDKYKIKN